MVEHRDQQRDWDAVLEHAQAVLAEVGGRIRLDDMLRALEDRGAPLGSSRRGLPGGLRARLAASATVDPDADGVVWISPKSRADDGDRSPRPASAEDSSSPANDIDWNALTAAAVVALQAAPARLWRPGELLGTAADAIGLPQGLRRGLHFGLVPRLLKEALIVQDADGRLQFAHASQSHSPAVRAGRAVPAAPAAEDGSSPVPAPAQPSPITRLTREVEEGSHLLARMEVYRRTAQIASWAGRARILQETIDEEVGPQEERRRALRGLFGRLSGLARAHDCEWIDALTPTWSTPDWTVYVRINEAIAGQKAPPELAIEKLMDYQRAVLAGLELPHRRLRPGEAEAAISEAAEILPADDPALKSAAARFGWGHARGVQRDRSGRDVPPRHEDIEDDGPSRAIVPDSVLAITRGKSALVLGGQGAREEHRRLLKEQLQLVDLDWPVGERNQASVFDPLVDRVRSGRYQIVLFLVSYVGHKSAPVVRAAKAAGVPVVYIQRGYNLGSVVRALAAQAPRNGAPHVASPLVP